MIRPRRRFAAPFVLVVGCSGAGTVPPAPPPLRPEPLPIDAAIDAEIDVPIDAAAVALAPDAAVLDPYNPPKWNVDPCKLPPDPGNPTCNPRPPAAVEARIIQLERRDDDLLITVAVGEDARIDSRWRAELLDGAGRKVRTKALGIIKTSRRMLYIKIPGLSELPDGARVRLTPP